MPDDVDKAAIPDGWIEVTRMLTYVGPVDWVTRTLEAGGITMERDGVVMIGRKTFPNGAYIKSGMIMWETEEAAATHTAAPAVAAAAPVPPAPEPTPTPANKVTIQDLHIPRPGGD